MLVCVCVTFSPQAAGIQGPFQIKNRKGGWVWVCFREMGGGSPFPIVAGGFLSKDSGNIRKIQYVTGEKSSESQQPP